MSSHFIESNLWCRLVPLSQLETHFNCLIGFYLSNGIYANVVVQQKKYVDNTRIKSNMKRLELNNPDPIVVSFNVLRISRSCSCWLTWWIPALGLSGLITAGSDLDLHLVILRRSEWVRPDHRPAEVIIIMIFDLIMRYYLRYYHSERTDWLLHKGNISPLSRLFSRSIAGVGQIFQQAWPPVVDSRPGRQGRGGALPSGDYQLPTTNLASHRSDLSQCDTTSHSEWSLSHPPSSSF